MEFTQEQQDYINELVSESTKGLFTQDDLEKRVQKEVDRRVETGIQKGIETNRQKWEDEYEKKARMTAEEIAEEQLKDKLAELSARENELANKSNTLNARTMLSEADIPKEHYERFIDMLVTTDGDSTVANVEKFVSTFNETKADLEKSIQSKYSNVVTPQGGSGGDGIVGKDDFRKMTYGDKLKLKTENPDLYNSLLD